MFQKDYNSMWFNILKNPFQCVVEMCESQKGGIRGGFIETDGSTLRWVIFWLKMTIFIECPLLNTYNKQQNILNWELIIDLQLDYENRCVIVS